MKIYVFPHAGGSSYAYSTFKKQFPEDMAVQVLELPGRGRRIREKLQTDVEEIANKLFEEISETLDSPYCLFGHSFGSLVAYLVLKKIGEAKKPLPVKFFASAGIGPRAIRNTKRYDLSEDNFWEMLEKIGGLTSEILDNKELRRAFEPIIRADFQACDTYQHQISKKIAVPIVLLLPEEDANYIESFKMWEEETTFPLKTYMFPGGHFYLLQCSKEVIDVVLGELKQPYIIN